MIRNETKQHEMTALPDKCKQAFKGILYNEYDNINKDMGNVDISDLLTSEIFTS